MLGVGHAAVTGHGGQSEERPYGLAVVAPARLEIKVRAQLEVVHQQHAQDDLQGSDVVGLAYYGTALEMAMDEGAL